MNVRFVDLFKLPATIILTMLSLATGPVLVISQILTIWQGAFLFLVLLVFLLFSALLNCYKLYRLSQADIKKLTDNRNGLIQAKDRYLEENSRLSNAITNLKLDNLQLSQQSAFLFTALLKGSIPDENTKLLNKVFSDMFSNNEIAGGKEIDGE